MHVMRTRLLVTLSILGALFLAGCAENEPDLGPGTAVDVVEQPGTEAMLDSVGPADAPARGQFSTSESSRQDVVNGFLAVTVDEPQEVADRAQDAVSTRGGRVDSRTDSPAVEDQIASSSLTLRIPVDELDATLGELRDLGTVTSSSLDRSDVTMQSQDLSARIAALQATVDRFRELLTTAADTADLIAIETALSDRQGELDSLRSQQQSLDDRIELATITLQLTATDPDEVSSGGVTGAIVDGWNALLSALGAGVLFIAAALPWLAFVAVLVGIVIVVRKIRRRRAKGQTPPAKPS